MKKDILSDGKLLLKPISLSDNQVVYDLFNDPKVIESYGDQLIPIPEAAEEFISEISQNGNRVWTIRFKSDVHRVIGICALHHWNKKDKTIEIGATLHSDYWGKQITGEAFRILLSFLEERLDVRQVIGKTTPTNINAMRLIQKLGFERCRTHEAEVWYVKTIKKN